MNASVLIVDDDPQVVKVMSSTLGSRGYEVRTASDAKSAMGAMRARWPGLVITDLEMPAMDGIELCRQVRDISNVPIIIISNTGDCRSEVAALDSGADDYLVTPFDSERLLARVRATLRRCAETPEAAVLGVGAFHIDFDDRRVRVHGQPVRLTPKEFDLFVFMARHPNRVLRHRTLLGAVWGEGSEDQSEYLRVFIGQLRKKFEADPSNPRYLTTEPWIGYRFNPTGMIQ
jgi:two-component system KDP operon response regulator KdpE